MNQAISGAGLFLVQAIVTLGTFAFLLRFVLQAVRADFYNPITQAIVRLTDPLLKPARKIVPPIGGLDVASLLIAVLFQFALIFLLFSGIQPATAFVLATFRLLMLVLDLFFWAMVIIVIISWVAPGSRHPGSDLLYQITEPLLGPLRRIIPPMGGLDFSVMVAFLLLVMVREYLIPGIAIELGISPSALG